MMLRTLGDQDSLLARALTSGDSQSRREATIEAVPFGPQGHSLGFLGLGLRFWLWLWRQLLFLSIHLVAGQASEPSPHPSASLS